MTRITAGDPNRDETAGRARYDPSEPPGEDLDRPLDGLHPLGIDVPRDRARGRDDAAVLRRRDSLPDRRAADARPGRVATRPGRAATDQGGGHVVRACR